MADALTPDRFVYGVPDGAPGEAATAALNSLRAPLAEGAPRLVVDYATAELVKTAANSFLATKISFINAMAELCSAAGADVTPNSPTRSAWTIGSAQVPRCRHWFRRRLPAQGHPRVHRPAPESSARTRH